MAQRTTYDSFTSWVEAKDDDLEERKHAEAEAKAAAEVAKARKMQLADVSFSRWTQIKALHERALLVRAAVVCLGITTSNHPIYMFSCAVFR